MLTQVRRAFLPIGIGLIGIAVFYLLQYFKPRPAPSDGVPRPTTVRIASAIETEARPSVIGFGEVRPGVRTQMVAQVSGRIISVAQEFIEGGEFEDGDILLKIEDTDYLAMVQEQRARVAAARVDLDQALADADVARKQLSEQKNPSPLALKKPQVARARSALKAAEASLSLAETNLARTEVTLPFAGRVESQSADLGQYVNPGTILGVVFGTKIAEVRVSLTDKQISVLGIPIGFNGGSENGLNTILSAKIAGDIHRWEGKLVRVDASIDPETRTVYGTVVVEDPYGETREIIWEPLVVGLYVELSIQGRLIQNLIQVPTQSLRAGNEVFVLTENGLLDIRQVEVAYIKPERVFIKSGVRSGENVIISAIRNPVTGMRLKTLDSTKVVSLPSTEDNEI